MKRLINPLLFLVLFIPLKHVFAHSGRLEGRISDNITNLPIERPKRFYDRRSFECNYRHIRVF
jgi:hypothetical protein